MEASSEVSTEKAVQEPSIVVEEEEAVIVPSVTVVSVVETKDEVSAVVKEEAPVVVKQEVTKLDPSSIKDVDLKGLVSKADAELARDAAGDMATLERKLKDVLSTKARSKKQIKARNIKVSGLRKQMADLRRSIAAAKVVELDATLVPIKEFPYVEQDAHVWAFKEAKRKAAIRKSLELLLVQEEQELSYLMDNCYRDVVVVHALKQELAVIEEPVVTASIEVLIGRADVCSALNKVTGTGSECSREDLLPHCEVIDIDAGVLFSLYQEMLILEEIWNETGEGVDKKVYLTALNKMRRYING